MRIVSRTTVPDKSDFYVEYTDRSLEGIKQLEKALRARGLLQGVTITAVDVGGTFIPVVIDVKE